MRKSQLAGLALLAAVLLGLLPAGAQSWDDVITGAPPPGRPTPPKRLTFMIAVKAKSKRDKPPSGCEVVLASGGYYFVSRRASVSMEVQSARLVTAAPGKGRKAARSVVIQLKQNHIRLFSDFTRNNLGKPVVIGRNGEVITAWKITRKISDGRLELPAKDLTQRQLKALVG